jgi:hypothetical protein
MNHNNNQDLIKENELLTQSSSTQSTLQQNSQVNSTIPLTREEIQDESPAIVSIKQHYNPQVVDGDISSFRHSKTPYVSSSKKDDVDVSHSSHDSRETQTVATLLPTTRLEVPPNQRSMYNMVSE